MNASEIYAATSSFRRKICGFCDLTRNCGKLGEICRFCVGPVETRFISCGAKVWLHRKESQIDDRVVVRFRLPIKFDDQVHVDFEGNAFGRGGLKHVRGELGGVSLEPAGIPISQTAGG
jgi:hypothetical protein